MNSVGEIDKDFGHSLKREAADVWAQLAEVSSRLRRVDIVVFALILVIGLFQAFSVEKSRYFTNDDVFYADSGRSLIEHGFYGINGYRETNMPPGLSAVVGILSAAAGSSRALILRVLALFGTLGFLASYELLRRQAPRIIAAAICLLLISSRIQFEFMAKSVCPCYPYLLTTVAALLVARKLEVSTHFASRIAWGALLAVFVVASLLFASAAIALLGAMVCSVVVIFFRDHRLGFARLKSYFLVLLVAVAVLGMSTRNGEHVNASAGISAAEWPLPGFPQSYLAQLKVKNGNHPELGLATPRDVAVRVFENACTDANLLSRMLLRRLPQVAWLSVFVAGPLLLIVFGWIISVWRKGGGLEEWYFAGYQCIYLLWPWDLETRFFFPIAPLACLYLWRGASALIVLTRSKPRLLGAIWLPVALCLTISAWLWMHGLGAASRFPNSGLEDEFSFAVWLLSALLAAWMVVAGTDWLASFCRLSGLSRRPMRVPQSLLRISSLVLLASLLGFGMTMQLQMAHAIAGENVTVDKGLPPDAEAAVWIRSHTAPGSVVMARHVPIICHYAERKVIWFPPSSDPKLLKEGIIRNRVDVVVVAHREFNYYLPTDDDGVAALMKTYPDILHLAYEAPNFNVYQVSGDAVRSSDRKVSLIH
jgi:hypothetical protein